MPVTVNEAGRMGASRRWADHVKVRPYIGDLPPRARQLILIAIEAEREKLEREKAAAA